MLEYLGSYPLYQVILEMAVLWICVYFVFRFVQGTRAAGAVKGFAIVLVVFTLIIRVMTRDSDAFGRLNFIYSQFLGLLAILLVVVFQPELRQAFIRLGQARLFGVGRGLGSSVPETIATAVTFLSKSQFGAIIAIEREVKLGGLVERGQTLNAELSASLIESIFWPNSPLHDLGVVIRGSQIIAAGVQFPLAEEGVLPSRYGSRHRAAVGLSMDSDAVIVIVSEENGAVSLAERGQLTYDIPREEFEAVLRTRLVTPSTEEAPTTVTDSKDDSPEQDMTDANPSTDQQNSPEKDHDDQLA